MRFYYKAQEKESHTIGKAISSIKNSGFGNIDYQSLQRNIGTITLKRGIMHS